MVLSYLAPQLDFCLQGILGAKLSNTSSVIQEGTASHYIATKMPDICQETVIS